MANKEKDARAHFGFLNLPFEIRLLIYENYMQVDRVIDLGAYNHAKVAPLLQLLFTCRQVYEEAYRVFYGINAFRIFSTDGKFIQSRKPLLSRFTAKHRAAMTIIELRLGPGWTKPPAAWAVTPSQGLADCTSVRTIKLFIELDPEDSSICSEWMASRNSYTDFGVTQLNNLLTALPSVREVRFDGFPSVQKNGPLMCALRGVCLDRDIKVAYGHMRGWGLDKPEHEYRATGAKEVGFLTRGLQHLVMSAQPAF